MYGTLSKHWRSLAAANIISEVEYRAATFQQYYKTVEEFIAPFEFDSSVSRAGLRLDHVSTVLTRCPFAAMFHESGDAAAFARAYIPSIRSWSESTFLGALNSTRPQAERAAIVDRLYSSYEADVAAAPALHRKDYVHCIQSISKSDVTEAKKDA